MPFTTLMPSPRQRFYTNAGTPAAFHKLYTYAAGTPNNKVAYQDSAGTVPHENPITLDAKGEALIYWSGAYKVDLKDPLGVQITGYPVDNFLASDPSVLTTTLRAELAASGGAALVGVIQSGAGAVARTGQDKLRDTVSVLDFGADPTGTTDSTAAIQAALNAARNVFVPAGTYLFSELTIPYRNTILRGASTRSAILKHTGSGTAITCGDASSTEPDGRGSYIDSGWFGFENFELMANGTIGIEAGKTRSTFLRIKGVYMRHRRDLEAADANNQFFPGSIALNCDNSPWLSSYATYMATIDGLFARGFETAINLRDVVNCWEIRGLYTIECKKQVALSNVTGITLFRPYFESNVAGASGVTFMAGGGNQVNLIAPTFELTNAAATQYAYVFVAGGVWEGVTVTGPKYLIQSDGNAINSRRISGTPPATFIELGRTYTSSINGIVPMLYAPGVTNAAPFQQPNFSRLGGFQQGNGKIKLGRGDSDAADHEISHDGSTYLLLDAYDGGVKFRVKGGADRLVVESFTGVVRSGGNNAQDLGSSTFYWKNLYATNIVIKPAAAVTPVNNGEVMLQLTSDTQLTFRVKGSDGIVRSGSVTLA